MTISKEVLDELLKDCKRPDDLLGESGLMKELRIKLMERMLGAELTAHLGYAAGQEAPPDQGNRRNGSSAKVLKGQDGEIPISVPRDRDGSFEPELVKKGQTRIDGMDDKIIGLYAAGLTVRDIRAHLEDVYGLQVSPDLISRVTDAVLDEVREWQSRALERMYPIVIFDALRVKIRDADSRMVKNKAVYVALGVTRDGLREVLGLWIAENEGAKFWLSVMNELRNRGVQDVLIAVVDGLKGFPEAITAAFPEATVQTCIVHLVRHSLNFCAWKDRKAVAADLRRIYSAPTAEQAAIELDAFEEKWAGKYASIAPAWRRAWQEVIPFFAFDPSIRKIIYTTNAIESLNRVIRKSIKTRGSFPTEEAATKLIYLAIRNFEKGGRNVREWFAARNQFAIMFEDRFNA
ncbi:MAG: IS256 family transposase [Agrobacterium sp.]|nr:IS256 family transposase [Agrobacterium sp.]